jgi:uncharacterized cupredoxin-like copper-binding protein
MDAATPAKLALLVVSLLALVSLVGCGGQGGINVDLTDNAINMSTTTAKAGNVTFHIRNMSTGENHEFVVLQTDLPAAQLPTGSDGEVQEDKLHSMGEQGDLVPGKSADLTLNLPAGHYAIICNDAGHYQAGMHVDFTTAQ